MQRPKARLYAVAAAGVTTTLFCFANTAEADLSLCAFRSGPNGPCTCKTADDAPGKFTTVKRSHCRKVSAVGKLKPGTGKSAVTKAVPARVVPIPSERPVASQEAQKASASSQSSQQIVTGINPTTSESRLDAVRIRGALICGVNEGLPGFSYRASSGEWAGIDVDYCRAIAAAILGDSTRVEFVPLDASSRFDALKSGRIDVLSRNTTWTMSRDVDMGLEFVGVLYFDGQGFMTSEQRGLVSAQQLSGATVCVQSATTTEANMAYYFKAHGVDVGVKTFQSRDEMVKAYLAGVCDAYSADRSALFADRAGFAEPTKHAILPEVISKEPLGPAVLQGDQEWTEIARWVLAGLINAEEVGLTREAALNGQELDGDAKRLNEGAGASGTKLRLEWNWLRAAVAAVGNYGEFYEANIGKGGTLGMDRGLNALWKKGGILFAPPMW